MRHHPRPAPAPPMPTLFNPADLPPVTNPAAGMSLDDQFVAFHVSNPWVYQALVALARDMVSRGRRTIGMKMLLEVLRWQYAISTSDVASDFKINNNYGSRYARLIMANEADLDGVFTLRVLTT